MTENESDYPTLWLDCMCSDSSHAVRLHLFPPYGMSCEGSMPDPPDLFVSLQLNPVYGFWKRLWSGLLYIVLGRVSRRDYHWAELCVRRDQVDELQAFLQQYRMAIDAYADRCAEVILEQSKEKPNG